MGIDDIIYLPRKSFIKCPTLYYSDFPGPSDYHQKDLLLDLKKKILPKEKGRPSRRVYISRKKARFRTVTNETEIIPILKKFNFEIVYSEDLSPQKQLELFSNTEYLISIHGAGLTNVIFMRPNTTLLELRKDTLGFVNGKLESNRLYNTYYHICDNTKMKYFYLNCPSPTPEMSRLYADVIVNPQELEDILKVSI